MELSESLKTKLDQLIAFLSNKKVVVAFSGGVDSSVLAYLANQYAAETILITETSLNSEKDWCWKLTELLDLITSPVDESCTNKETNIFAFELVVVDVVDVCIGSVLVDVVVVVDVVVEKVVVVDVVVDEVGVVVPVVVEVVEVVVTISP